MITQPRLFITGQDIHEAYNEATSPPALREAYARAGTPFKLDTWKDLSDRSKQLYNQMAEELNKKLGTRGVA